MGLLDNLWDMVPMADQFGMGRGDPNPYSLQGQQLRDIGMQPYDPSNPMAFYAQNVQALSHLGYPARLPEAHAAPEVQLMINRFIDERNQRLLGTAATRGRQAYGRMGQLFGAGRRLLGAGLQESRAAYGRGRGALRQGLSNLQTYRPGGAAAMVSPYYTGLAQQHGMEAGAIERATSQAAGLYAQQAGYMPGQAQFELQQALMRQMVPPDVMFRYHELTRRSAEHAAAQRARTDQIIAGLGSIGGIVGAVAG